MDSDFSIWFLLAAAATLFELVSKWRDRKKPRDESLAQDDVEYDDAEYDAADIREPVPEAKPTDDGYVIRRPIPKEEWEAAIREAGTVKRDSPKQHRMDVVALEEASIEGLSFETPVDAPVLKKD